MVSGLLDGLFTPLSIRNRQTRNRFVLPAMQLGLTLDNGPSDELVAYYSRCAEGGMGIVITEALAIGHPSSTSHNSGHIVPRTGPLWRKAVDAVHAHGSLFFLQLFHAGAIRKEGRGGPDPTYPTLSPSGLYQGGKRAGQAATRQQLAEIRDAYVEAALIAQSIGADGVEVHAAHGYFLDQFLWPETNLRDDEYGGDILGRARFPAEIVESIRAAVGPDFIISFRFSQWKEVDYTAKIVDSPDELATLVATVRAAGADMIHASARRFYVPEWPESDLGIAGWAKQCADSDAVIVANGSVGLNIDMMTTFFAQDKIMGTSRESMAEVSRRFNNGEFDLISVGRSVIGDQNWVRKVREGRFDEIEVFNRALIAANSEQWDPGVIGEAHGVKKAYSS